MTGSLLEVRLTRAFGALLPLRIARFAAFEITIVGAALRFLFGGWRRATPAGFTYHRESGLRLLLMFLPLIGLADVLLLELVVLPDAAPWLRVVVHALAVYGLIWLVGIYATARARPHELVDGTLALRRGILRRVEVPIADIVSIDPLPAFADDWKKRAYLRGALRLDLAGAAILELRLRAAVRPFGIFGEGAPGTRILVAVDDPAAFSAALHRDA